MKYRAVFDTLVRGCSATKTLLVSAKSLEAAERIARTSRVKKKLRRHTGFVNWSLSCVKECYERPKATFTFPIKKRTDMDQQVQQEIGVAANKMTSEMLAPSIFNVYSTCMGEPGEWAQADPFTWDKIATKAIRLIDSNIRDQASMSAKALAKTLFGWGHDVDFTGIENAWEAATPTEKYAWEAVGRHLVNCIDSEVNSVNVGELEERIIQWFNARIVSIN